MIFEYNQTRTKTGDIRKAEIRTDITIKTPKEIPMTLYL
jgi:hypothetical protein